MPSDLLIRITGDSDNFQKALDAAKEKSENLSDQLTSVAKYAAVAFAALTAEAYESLKAYQGQEIAVNTLTQALQQQGTYTPQLVQQYRDIASAIQAKTGADDDQILKGVAVLQGMVGQTKVSNELIKSVVDLAARNKTDVVSAFELVGRAATNSTEILKRHGLTVEDTGTRSGNLANITKALNDQLGGTAEAAAQGLGGTAKLSAQFEDMQKKIGEQLAPAVTMLINGFTALFEYIGESPNLVKFGVAVGVAATAVIGLVGALAAGGAAWLAYQAAMAAGLVATEAMTVATRVLIGATGLGLILVAVGLVYEYWDSIWPRMQGVFKGFVSTVIELIGGLGQAFKGLWDGRPEEITAGLARARGALSAGLQEYNTVVKTKTDEKVAITAAAENKMTQAQIDAAAKREALTEAHENRLLAIRAGKRQLLIDQYTQESKEVIDLQTQRNQVLAQMDDENNKSIMGVLKTRLDQIKTLMAQAQAEEIATRGILNTQILAQDQEFQNLDYQQQVEFLQKNQVALAAQVQTENDARKKAALDRATQQIADNNTFLANQNKFGTAYATIYKTMHSEIYNGTKSAAGDLEALTASSNSTLKGIGKAAAVANIVIKTAEAAMNIYAGFATIPIIGPALGVAGAAAAVAFGAEQIGAVTAAADGGLITGGIRGMDSVPAMLMPGEMVVPTKNFEEVISAVAGSRTGTGGQGGMVTVELLLRDDLIDMIEARIVERQNLNTSLLRAN